MSRIASAIASSVCASFVVGVTVYMTSMLWSGYRLRFKKDHQDPPTNE